MSKEEGAKTVVVGGKFGVDQQYCGTVGGQSTDFSTIDTEIKVNLTISYICRVLTRLCQQTAHLKDSPLAPPDLSVIIILVESPSLTIV